MSLDPYVLFLLAAGGLVLLVAWLPLAIARAPLSLPIVCVIVGGVAFAGPWAPGEVAPLQSLPLTERVAEFVVLIALMGAGLKLDRPFRLRGWSATWRLLAIAMPLTVLLIWGLGTLAGLTPVAALLLAAALAPTDPVLASDVQVGPPRSGEEDEVRFALTSEAGLNDGLAFPFVNLAIAGAVVGFTGPELGRWFGVDVIWKLGAGLVVGLAVGRVAAWLAFRAPRSKALSTAGDGFVAIGVTLVSYAATELVHGYGFLAVFVTALAFRAADREHAYHARLHDFVDQAERLCVMAVLVLFGGAIADGLFALVTWQDALLALAILLLVRPLAGLVSLIGWPRPRYEKLLTAFFGIRGVGTIYYLAHAMNEAVFVESPRLLGVAGLVILFSILLHGVTATPLMRRMDDRRAADREKSAAGAGPT